LQDLTINATLGDYVSSIHRGENLEAFSNHTRLQKLTWFFFQKRFI